MAEMKVVNNVLPQLEATSVADKRESVQKAIEAGNELQNAALERCSETASPDKLARQAYDRMYHTHNRG